MRSLVSSQCIGCGACLDVCQNRALIFEKDENGFTKAFRSERCIGCGACTRFCKERDIVKVSLPRRKMPLTYAAWAKQKETHSVGNSGGIFMALAQEWIRSGGVVAAPRYDANFVPRFFCAKTEEEIKSQAWSKFVQSETGPIFREIKSYLQKAIRVLFVGAPCQVKGLYGYLNGDCGGLLTVQFPCIGMPPQWFYQEYLKDLAGCALSGIQAVYGEVLDNSGEREMRCVLEDQSIVTESAKSSIYVRAWNSFLCVDDNCCRCRDNIAPVCADMTWGNFWYLGELKKFDVRKEKYRDECSMLLIHSEKAEKVICAMKDVLALFPRPYCEAEIGHTMFQCPASEHLLMRRYVGSLRRERFQKEWKTKDWVHLKRLFFDEKKQASGSFAVAANLSQKQKAIIWQMLYYYHKILR
jgi:hypothetical protein